MTHRDRAGIPCTILLVDDDASVRDGLRRVLETEGWTVVTADGGDSALAQMQSRLPELIITDLCMDGINGWEFLLECRVKYPLCPIFIITALDPQTTRGAAQAATRYFQKPLDIDDLLGAVRHHLSAPNSSHPSASSIGARLT